MVELPNNFKLKLYERVGSTNTVAKELAEEGAPSFTLVVSAEQDGGRGRFNRQWVSNRGNLFYSLLIRLDINTPMLHELTFVTAVATAQTIKSFLPSERSVSIKWPNDIIVDDHKVSGALLEGSSDAGWVVIGIGINVAVTPTSAGAASLFVHSPSSLKDLGGGDLSIEDVYTRLSADINEWYEEWLKAGLSGRIFREFKELLWRKGQEVRVSFNADKGEYLQGINDGIDEKGCLLLRMPDGKQKTITAADVLAPLPF